MFKNTTTLPQRMGGERASETVWSAINLCPRADERGPSAHGEKRETRARSRSPIRDSKPAYSRERVESERRTAGCETELPIATATTSSAAHDRFSRGRDKTRTILADVSRPTQSRSSRKRRETFRVLRIPFRV